MRKAFIETLIKQARQDNDIWLLVADVGFNLVEPFRDRFPDRFINVGIAEQNMIGVAAGLALSGKKVFCYSLGNFPTLRCLEQIRNDICYHNLPVTIVNSGAGLYYGALGSSHHATEDIAIMRALPNMSVLSPCDPTETRFCADYIFNQSAPFYLRLQGSHDENYFNVDTTINCDNIILATGSITGEALIAKELLRDKKIDVNVLSVPIIKPRSMELFELIYRKKCKRIYTLEEHNLDGGFGSSVLEEVVEWCEKPLLIYRFGLQDKLCKEVGSQQYLRRLNGIDAEGIANKIREVVNE